MPPHMQVALPQPWAFSPPDTSLYSVPGSSLPSSLTCKNFLAFVLWNVSGCLPLSHLKPPHFPRSDFILMSTLVTAGQAPPIEVILQASSLPHLGYWDVLPASWLSTHVDNSFVLPCRSRGGASLLSRGQVIPMVWVLWRKDCSVSLHPDVWHVAWGSANPHTMPKLSSMWARRSLGLCRQLIPNSLCFFPAVKIMTSY